MEKKLLNVKQLSEYISMPVATIYTYVHTRKIPEYCIRRIDRALKFDVVQVDRWVNEVSAPQAVLKNAMVTGMQCVIGDIPIELDVRYGTNWAKHPIKQPSAISAIFPDSSHTADRCQTGLISAICPSDLEVNL